MAYAAQIEKLADDAIELIAKAHHQAMLERNLHRRLEDLAWDQMAPVGREFGSPDFDRLMEEDFRNQAGVFDPKLKEHFAEFDATEKLPVQRLSEN